MTDTVERYPGGLALAALGGASEEWQQGYRWGWEDAAAREANPSPPPSRKERRERRRGGGGVVGGFFVLRNCNVRVFSPGTKEGYYAGQAAYEQGNR